MSTYKLYNLKASLIRTFSKYNKVAKQPTNYQNNNKNKKRYKNSKNWPPCTINLKITELYIVLVRLSICLGVLLE